MITKESKFNNILTEIAKDFKKTHVKEKINITKWENTAFKAVYPAPRTGQLFGVVGHHMGLRKHVNQFIDLGYKMNDIYLFEISNSMFERLFKRSLVLYGEEWTVNHVFEGDLKQYLNSTKLNVTHVDFDVTDAWPSSKYDSDINLILSKSTIQTATFVGSMRSGKGFEKSDQSKSIDHLNIFKYIDTKFFARSEVAKAYNGLYYLVNGVTFTEQYIKRQYEDKYQDFEIMFKKYPGLEGTPMISMIFAKTRSNIWDTIGSDVEEIDIKRVVWAFIRVFNTTRDILEHEIRKGKYSQTQKNQMRSTLANLIKFLSTNPHAREVLYKLKINLDPLRF